MSLAPGLRLGPYEVIAPAGSGGMGEVYRARDTRLNRYVALKVLPALFASDPERLARFDREAQILAAMGHPNIAGILGLEQNGPTSALVLEFVEGVTLTEELASGPIPYRDALTYARQIAEALEAAHEQGIVHRDLKPANIKLRPDGLVKVLDFGLAKALDARPLTSDLAESPTITSPAMTAQGVILGTAAYMSPEQARGRVVDKRADNWAFGCVLFEMLTGAPAFQGDTVTDTLAAVVRSEPDWSTLPAHVSPVIRSLVRRCLEKDAKRRLRDIGEARIAIENALEGKDDLLAAPARPSASRRALLATVIGAALVAGLGVAVLMWAFLRPAPDVMRLSIVPPDDAALIGHAIAVTPDGRHVVYASGNGTQLSVRALDQLSPVHLPGLGSPNYPFVSPDGRAVGFFDGLNALKTIPITGGAATTLCGLRGAAGRGGAWTEDGHIVFATDDPATGLWRVPERGGTPELLTTPVEGDGDQLWPQVLPGGRAALVTVMPGANRRASGPRVAIVDLASGAQKVLMPGRGAHYVPTGHLIYGAAGALRAIGFDLDRLETRGTSVPVVEGIAGAAATTLSTAGSLGVAIAGDGTLLYVPEVSDRTGRLAWVDREGREERIPAPARGYVIPRVSRTGDRIAVDTRDGGGADVWVWDVAQRTLTRATFGTSVYPVWTHDGRIVHTTFDEARVGRLFLRRPDGSTQSTRLTEGANSRYAGSVSPDDARLLFREEGGDSGVDIGMLFLKEGNRVESLIATPANELNPEISPDGNWVAYESNQSGENEIYVRPFPDVNAGLWQVSTTGGRQPAWNPAARELFYRAPDGSLMAVPVVLAPRFAAGQPSRVLAGTYLHSGPYRSYDVSPDGTRFLMIAPDDQAPRRASDGAIVVVQHWFEELTRALPR